MATRKGKTMDTKKSGKETKEKAQKKKKETKEKAQKKKEEKETKEKAQKNNCKMMSTMRTHMAAVLNYDDTLICSSSKDKMEDWIVTAVTAQAKNSTHEFDKHFCVKTSNGTCAEYNTVFCARGSEETDVANQFCVGRQTLRKSIAKSVSQSARLSAKGYRKGKQIKEGLKHQMKNMEALKTMDRYYGRTTDGQLCLISSTYGSEAVFMGTTTTVKGMEANKATETHQRIEYLKLTVCKSKELDQPTTFISQLKALKVSDITSDTEEPQEEGVVDHQKCAEKARPSLFQDPFQLAAKASNMRCTVKKVIVGASDLGGISKIDGAQDEFNPWWKQPVPPPRRKGKTKGKEVKHAEKMNHILEQIEKGGNGHEENRIMMEALSNLNKAAKMMSTVMTVTVP